MSTVAQLPERAGPDRSLSVGPSLRAELVAPRGTLPTFALAELREFVLRGENDSAACEEVLAQACRMASAIDLAIGDGLAALTRGDRLIRLGSRTWATTRRTSWVCRARQLEVMAEVPGFGLSVGKSYDVTRVEMLSW